jgi:hypothetical protein
MRRFWFILVPMEYQVPQFIEVEDKIFGPFTLKQFIYLAGGAGICALLFFTLPLFIAGLLAIPVAAFSLALAFYRMNGKPFIEIVEAAFNYAIGKRLYLWRRDDSPRAAPPPMAAPAPEERAQALPKVTPGKLRDLAWSLDVQDKQQ